jgi:3-hydroxyisobutyrate dehydrogenase-like beta-hydroxyacid dehydrogenase
MRIGTIGAGEVALAVAREALARGHEIVLSSCLWHLANHPDDRKPLVAEPALIPTAVEEFLRARRAGA